MEEFLSRLKEAVSRKDTRQLATIAAELKQFREEVEAIYSQVVDPGTTQTVEQVHSIQSRQFMIDMLPTIQRWLATLPRGAVLDVLDVGPSSGGGTELLAGLYARCRLGYRMRVSVIDIRAVWKPYIEAMCPNIGEFFIGDVYKLDRRFDAVICSHVVEHVREPIGFVRRLQQIARQRVFLAGPFNEDRARMSRNHINVIDEEFIRELAPLSFVEMTSHGWGLFERARMFIAELAGSG
jgi:2-polyprenyl-3-methyl-5-hydroxy-6-metoxy-1,4-benzoquinol methylase